MFLPIIGAFFEAAGMIYQKKILKVKSMNFKNYTVFEFFAIVLMSIPILLFTWRVDSGAFRFHRVLLFVVVIIISILANLFIFYSLKREDLTEFEPVWLMQPLFTVLLAFLIYPDERNWIYVGLALIATTTIVVAHVQKSHIVLNRYLLAALFGSFLFAVELVLSKPLLEFYSPFTFYFVRAFFIFVVTLFLFQPKFHGIKKKIWSYIFVVGLLWILYRAIIYYGYETFGIIYTTLIFVLSPVLIILFAIIFLKERPSIRQIISTIIILACVIAAFFVK